MDALILLPPVRPISDGHDVVRVVQPGPLELPVRQLLEQSAEEARTDLADVVHAHVELVPLLDEGVEPAAGLRSVNGSG